MRHTTARSLAALTTTAAALALGLSACTSDVPAPAQSTPAPTSAPSADPSPSAGTSQAPQSAQSAKPVETDEPDPTDDGTWTLDAQEKPKGAPSDGPATVTDVRVGSHGEFDRVVVEFDRPFEAGWWVNWVDAPHEQGRGEVIDLQGPAFLDVVIDGAAMESTEEQQAIMYKGSRSLETGGIRVAYDGTFESTTHIAIGMDAKRGYQIYQLTGPNRVVIDVRR